MKPPIEASAAKESTRAWWRSPGIVYFIAAGSPPLAIKIGMAAQTGNNTIKSTLKRRLAAIQSSNHELVQLIGVRKFTKGEYPTRDAEIFERELHLEFHELQRFKPHSRGAEWFNAAPELIERISEVSIPPSDLDVPEFYGEIK